MTYLPGRLDRVAGSAARTLLRWAGGRHSSSQRTWVRALSAELDEIEAGVDQLAWALGVLPLVLVERGPALGHVLRSRLLWLATAGGLGGLRVYGPAVASGIATMAWSYANRDLDLPLPWIAVLLFTPFYVLRGFLAARRRPGEVAVVIGAVTAVVGYAVVVVGFAVYLGVTKSGEAVILLVFGVAFAFFVAFFGAMCGAIGAALADRFATIRSVRSRHRRAS